MRNHALEIARRSEEGLGEEQFSFIDSCPSRMMGSCSPLPQGPMTVGIDGGYVRDWTNKKSNFELIVGRSCTLGRRDAKRFGFVYGHDDRPKRRLFEMLQSQGMQMNQQITFVSDGADNVRDLQFYLNPHAEHVLDWFHLTMRITVLDQYAKGVVRLDEKLGEEIREDLQRVKWYCWHGNVYEALRHIRFVEMDAEELFYGFEEDHPKADHRKPQKAPEGHWRVQELHREQRRHDPELRREAPLRRSYLHSPR